MIECWIQTTISCAIQACSLPGKIETCSKFPFCYPCEHDQNYWSDQCNQQVPTRGGTCWALLREAFIPAGGSCCPPNSCI